MRQQLARTPADQRTPREVAQLTALEFVLGLGRADAARVAATIDATGYQPLPLEGPLPERPGKPTFAEGIGAYVASRPQVELAELPVELVTVLSPHELRDENPAVAAWMLSTNDLAVVFSPPEPPIANWLTEEGLLVVRVRAARGTVVGGNLLEALLAE